MHENGIMYTAKTNYTKFTWDNKYPINRNSGKNNNRIVKNGKKNSDSSINTLFNNKINFRGISYKNFFPEYHHLGVKL